MTYQFQYATALERCSMLSSFEGRDYVGGDGESLFLTVKITEQDKPLILTYMEQAARDMETRLDNMVTSTEYDTDGFTWELRTEETRWNPDKRMDNSVREALVGYAMARWLEDRKPARKAAYDEIWNGSATMAVANLYRKRAPELD